MERIRRRLTGNVLDDPSASSLPRATPAIIAPRAAPERLTLTWVGHSTFVMQIGGLNILTDPVWSERASPVQRIGPRRRTAPGVALDALPPIDLVLISHDHYDHLDAVTVRQLARRHPRARWVAPLGVRSWLEQRGVANVTEHDWWDETRIEGGDPVATRSCMVTSVPAQHFSGRGLTGRDRSLWCGWSVRCATAQGSRCVYYAGDTGLHPEFSEIGRRVGPFDAIMLPIGAYDPRWFMRPVHMDPEEAVDAFLALTRSTAGGSSGGSSAARAVMVGMHWGTFKLTDEPLDEPPRRARDAWNHAGLDGTDLWILAHGETRELEVLAGRAVAL